jgi:hypothetical protein
MAQTSSSDAPDGSCKKKEKDKMKGTHTIFFFLFNERRVEANAGRGHERCVRGNRSAAP